MPTEQEVREAVEEGMRVFQESCELAHQIIFNWVVYPANMITDQQGKLMDAAIKLSVLQSQGANDQRVAQTIVLCKGSIKALTQDALRAARRNHERLPFVDFLQQRQITERLRETGGS